MRIRQCCHRDPPLRWCGLIRRHHHSPTLAMQPAGQDPEARLAPGTGTLPLCSRTNASPFGIILLLVWGKLEHGMIPAVAGFEGAPSLDNSSRYPQVIHDWFINLGV